VPVALALVLAAVVAVIMDRGRGAARRRSARSPRTGLLKPGMLWLALFYLAPAHHAAALSLSTLPSRFAVEAEFDWNLGNYSTGVHRLRPAVHPRVPVRRHRHGAHHRDRLPARLRDRVPRWSLQDLLLGLVVIPFFTSYLIRTIAWRSLLSDTGQVVQLFDTIGCRGCSRQIGIMDNGRILNTPGR
jgi:spermidine/putrescine transport system permease protein